jgi:hypothetical protein
MTANPRSMRFAPDEILSGMLATLEGDRFSDDAAALSTTFDGLASRLSLFSGFAADADSSALTKALDKLEAKTYLTHGAGEYVLTTDGRAACVSSKRTLFNRADCEQLEDAAHALNAS